MQDKDGIIWPLDTFKGLHALGFNFLFCIIAVVVVHFAFSYPTVSGLIPDPFFRIYLKNIHKSKHGSDSGTYDNEGRFVPQKFEDMFSKYADDKDYITVRDVFNMLKGQRLLADPFGWAAVSIECLYNGSPCWWHTMADIDLGFTTYILLWPEDGRMKKEDIRKLYDGSLFDEMAKERKHSSK